MMKYIVLFSLFYFFSCSNNQEEINQLFPTVKDNAEYAFDGHLLYSDSAKIKVRLDYVTLKKFKKNGEALTEFPDGIHTEFYDNNQKPTSWLVSKYAIRADKKGNVTARDSVVLYNAEGDKLETSELIWDEKEGIVRTDKFVRISQPMKGDTSYGYGFKATQDFSEFEIGKFSGKGSIKGFQ
ncbi:LPS export ABC transporter periplasmic protein LptC [Saprospiraceae bacterium]|nr:LPS export ABC transporter periplasmic protein LptC [Saprospiraceae bacterium]